jgi:hypothetical protein
MNKKEVLLMNNNEKVKLLNEVKDLLLDYVMVSTQQDLYTEEYREKLSNTYKLYEKLLERQLHITELDWLDEYYKEINN